MVIDLLSLLVYPALQTQDRLVSGLLDHVALMSDQLSHDARATCLYALRNQRNVHDARIEYLLGFPGDSASYSLGLVSMSQQTSNHVKHCAPSSSIGSNVPAIPFTLRKWEMVQDATPNASENDTSLNLTLFGARKALT